MDGRKRDVQWVARECGTSNMCVDGSSGSMPQESTQERLGEQPH